MSSKWLNNIGRILRKKDGGFFLVFERQKDKNKNYIGENPFPLVITEGTYFQMKAKKDDLQRLVDNGTMTQELADKICETVRFEISKAPDREGEAKAAAPAPATAKKNDPEGVNF